MIGRPAHDQEPDTVPRLEHSVHHTPAAPTAPSCWPATALAREEPALAVRATVLVVLNQSVLRSGAWEQGDQDWTQMSACMVLYGLSL